MANVIRRSSEDKSIRRKLLKYILTKIDKKDMTIINLKKISHVYIFFSIIFSFSPPPLGTVGTLYRYYTLYNISKYLKVLLIF